MGSISRKLRKRGLGGDTAALRRANRIERMAAERQVERRAGALRGHFVPGTVESVSIDGQNLPGLTATAERRLSDGEPLRVAGYALASPLAVELAAEAGARAEQIVRERIATEAGGVLVGNVVVAPEDAEATRAEQRHGIPSGSLAATRRRDPRALLLAVAALAGMGIVVSPKGER